MLTRPRDHDADTFAVGKDELHHLKSHGGNTVKTDHGGGKILGEGLDESPLPGRGDLAEFQRNPVIIDGVFQTIIKTFEGFRQGNCHVDRHALRNGTFLVRNAHPGHETQAFDLNVIAHEYRINRTARRGRPAALFLPQPKADVADIFRPEAFLHAQEKLALHALKLVMNGGMQHLNTQHLALEGEWTGIL